MSNKQESYKLLNAELMAEVQKLRLIIADYKRQVVTLVRENLGLREARILQNTTNGERQPKQISGVKNLMRRWTFDSDCLAPPPLEVSRASRPISSSYRRDSDIDVVLEVCEEMPEIGRLMSRPITPAYENDDTSSDEEENSPPDNNFFRKIAGSCWPRSRTT